MKQIGDKLGNNEVLKTLTKTLTFVDADANADAAAGGSTKAFRKRCSGELKAHKFLDCARIRICAVIASNKVLEIIHDTASFSLQIQSYQTCILIKKVLFNLLPSIGET